MLAVLRCHRPEAIDLAVSLPEAGKDSRRLGIGLFALLTATTNQACDAW